MRYSTPFFKSRTRAHNIDNLEWGLYCYYSCLLSFYLNFVAKIDNLSQYGLASIRITEAKINRRGASNSPS